MKGKKLYDYRTAMPNFKGRFSKGYVIDDATYRKKKKESLLKKISESKQSIILKKKNNVYHLIKTSKSRTSKNKIQNDQNSHSVAEFYKNFFKVKQIRTSIFVGNDRQITGVMGPGG